MPPNDATPLVRGDPYAAPGTRIVTLRVLATTDLHMQYLGFDYVADRQGQHGGLASLSSIIKTARTEATAQGAMCLLLDNGDLFQGNSFGAAIAKQALSPDHPVAAVLNHLSYDAIGLGNHDLDHGLPYLRGLADQLNMPLISSNLSLKNMGCIQSSVLLNFPDMTNGPRIGLLSVMPVETAIWAATQLAPTDRLMDPFDILPAAVANLRRAGADLVILLAHQGISETPLNRGALAFAELDGIDALITGHTHLRFPGGDHPQTVDIDNRKGTLAERPTVMAGFEASDLAVLDLTCASNQAGDWTVIDHRAELRANSPTVPKDRRIEEICEASHQATRKDLRSVVGHTNRTLHNYFALAAPPTTSALVAHAQASFVAAALHGSAFEDIPILSCVSAQTAGGRGGAQHYIHLPPGPIRRRHIAGLCPHQNLIGAAVVSGSQLLHWLETSAQIFNQLSPYDADQPLVRPDVPAFSFDTIYGVSYEIDPCQPFGQRIKHLKFRNTGIKPDQRFVMAASAFRLAGGGNVSPDQLKPINLQMQTTEDQALESALRNRAAASDTLPEPWHLHSSHPVQAVLETAPAATSHLADIAAFSPEVLEKTASGFLKIRLTL